MNGLMNGRLSPPAAPRRGQYQHGGPADPRVAEGLPDFRSPRVVSVCSWCRKIRDAAGCWTPAERGFLENAGLSLTHGLCPECARKHFPRRSAAA